jgi:hypothetical protein
MNKPSRRILLFLAIASVFIVLLFLVIPKNTNQVPVVTTPLKNDSNAVINKIIQKDKSYPVSSLLLAETYGGSENDYKEIDFNYLQTSITAVQQKQLDQLSNIAKKKPNIRIELTQVVNTNDEMGNLAICLAKNRYIGLPDTLTNATLHDISAVNTTDSAFISYVNTALKDPTSATLSIQEKCILLLGEKKISESVNTIMQQRNKTVRDYLLQQKAPVQNFFIHTTNKLNDPNLDNFPKLIINVASDYEEKKN